MALYDWDRTCLIPALVKAIYKNGASQLAQMVKNLPAMQQTWVQSLGQKDPLEKGITTHSNILAWRIPWTEEPGRPQSMELQRMGHKWATHTHTLTEQLTLHTHVYRNTHTHNHTTSPSSQWNCLTLPKCFILFLSLVSHTLFVLHEKVSPLFT